MNSKKIFSWFVIIALIVSVSINIYSLSKSENKYDKYRDEISALNSEIKSLNKEINDVNIKNNSENDISDDNDNLEDNEEDEEITNNKNYQKTIEKFIEYAFDSSNETYVIRKKLAKEYMSENFYNTLFSSDNINEDELKIKTKVDSVEVFMSEDNRTAIAFYKLTESKANEEYEETYNKYVKIYLNDDGKVEKINSLSNDEWGI